MAFPLSLDVSRICEEFDAVAFKAGKELAPKLIGCVVLARLSGTDSMKPFWKRSSPAVSVTSGASGTSYSSYYSNVKEIATPWRACIIIMAYMTPLYVGIELTLVPISSMNVHGSAPFDNPALWVPIAPNRAGQDTCPSVEILPRWPDSHSFVGVGLSFKMRCCIPKAHVSSSSHVSSEEVVRLQSWAAHSNSRSHYKTMNSSSSIVNPDPPYPFRYAIQHYGELAPLPSEQSEMAIFTQDNTCGWERENTLIALFLKGLLDAGLDSPFSHSMDRSSPQGRLPVFESQSEYAVFCLVSIVTTPFFNDLLPLADCLALSLTHPALTRPAQRLLYRLLSVNSDSQIQRALHALRSQPDLLPLIEIFHLNTSYSGADFPPCGASILQLVGPWVSEVNIVCNQLDQVADMLDAIGFTPGLTTLVLSCTGLESAQSRSFSIMWPFTEILADGLINLRHIILVGLTLSFYESPDLVTNFETFELTRCHVYSPDGDGDPSEVSLEKMLRGSMVVLRSLKLVSVTGVSLQSIEAMIQRSSEQLLHLHISEVCPWASTPISLRAALENTSLDSLEINNTGFFDFEDYIRKSRKPWRMVYDVYLWEYLARTTYDQWEVVYNIDYTDGDDYRPFSEDSC